VVVADWEGAGMLGRCSKGDEPEAKWSWEKDCRKMDGEVD
jgi:hypothetical protein